MNELWGLYDGTGKELIPVRYGYFDAEDSDWSKGWVYVDDKSRRKKGYVNFRNGLTIEPVYDSLLALPQCFIAKTEEGRKSTHTVLDLKGNPIAVYDEYLRVEWKRDIGLLAALHDGKYAILDQKTGKAVTPFRYGYLQSAAPSLAWATIGRENILVDAKGREYRIQK